jgi:ATP-dependent Clp protease ATP-binding subunit ClpC
MFERFSDRSRQAIVLAQEEASGFNHGHIGTEHLLLGLLHEGDNSAARVLKSLDVTLDAARNEVQAVVGRGLQKPSGHLPFTPRAKQALAISLRESLQLGDNRIVPGHLLLGLIGQDGNVATQVLGELNGSLSDLRERVIRELSRGDGGQDFSHYVDKSKITESVETGIPVTALCGKVWVPTRNPKHFPMCPSCKNIYEHLPSG